MILISILLILAVLVVAGAVKVVPRLLALGRQSRREEELRATLVPREQLVLKGDEPPAELAAVLDAARSGDWRPAAGYLAEVGAYRDASLRWARLGPLCTMAAEDDTWLRRWREEDPRSAAAALVQTSALVGRAWEIRTSKPASEVSTEQFRGFREVLGEAELVALQAVETAPAEDPNPWVAQIAIAMGLNRPHEDFRGLWAEIVARDPHHLRAHEAALQYWCAKWHGSHELMHAFVDTALAGAPGGSLLTVLRIQAFFEQITRDKAPAEAYRTPEFTAAVDALLADMEQADPAHPYLQDARGWAAWGLVKSARPVQALELFRAMGREVAGPWFLYDDPRGAFYRMRDNCVQAVAREWVPSGQREGSMV
ncbi:DUF4034 domain-containing protein [Kitasatospora purpeofusca]|uniref:DUF4034 domain-containing protein n=1 Tax=Kitasatospora purpeofusca TaxID=67352 RepID=UPI0034113778